MRTTVVIDDALESKLKGLASKKGLSTFVNNCLREHFAKEERKRRLRALEGCYARASRGKGRAKELEVLDREDWPEW